MSSVLDTRQSPHARLTPLPLGAVKLRDGFWTPRRQVNRETTLPSQYRKCEETGRIDNFRRAAGKIDRPFQGRYYNDSDVYKWVEAVAYALAESPDAELTSLLDAVISEIAAAQCEDGYLNTHFTRQREEERWTNLRDLHELYCAGHLIQAAVAVRRCTGRDDLLQVAIRLADLICALFGPGGREGTCGHQEIELALVELYRETRRPAYLAQAELFIERRGRRPGVIGGSPYHQDHAPFTELDSVVGHAVRMMYYCCGATDLIAETGNPAYRRSLDRLWTSMTSRRSYVSGGIGSRYEGEAFGCDYELPNDRAYAETCAAIGAMMWAWRMLHLEGEPSFADHMEWVLYNAIPCGLSLSGEEYFYQNPLSDEGSHRRLPWFDCACCPPNIARLLAALPAYFASSSGTELWIHLYAAGEVRADLDGGSLAMRVETDYPWDGRIRLVIERAPRTPTAVRLRIPGWCRAPELRVNGEPFPAVAGEYAVLERSWVPGDEIQLNLRMEPRRLTAHPLVPGVEGRIALARGPLLYCIEGCDLGFDPREAVLPTAGGLEPRWVPEVLGGVVVLEADGLRRRPGAGWRDALYADSGTVAWQEPRSVRLTAVPYYAWANRDPGGMAVWISGTD